jgi:hypothetical protein
MNFKKLVVLAAFAFSASAAPITFQFAGTVTQVPIDDFSTGIAFQDSFQGSFTFDPDAANTISSSTGGSYLSLGQSFGITVDIDSFTFSRFGMLAVGVQTGTPDFYTVLAETFIGQPGDNLTFDMILEDLTGTAITSNLQPSTPPDLSLFSQRDFHLDDVDLSGNELQVDGHLTSLTLAAVPEPSLGWLVAGAVVLLLSGRSRNRSRTWVFAAAMGAGVCPMYAVDGVVLINQATALAGSVTPGDAPGFPVTISVSGSYKLSGNLTVPDANTNAITITADNVSIDLNGFAILGPTVCTGSPVTSCAPTGTGIGIFSNNSGIAVINGTVHGMGSAGVEILGGDNRVERVKAVGNAGTGISPGNGQSSVSFSVASFNRFNGIFGNGTMTDNLVEGNGQSGLTFAGVVINNVSRKNGGDGITGVGVVSHNTSVANTGKGITPLCPSVVTENTVIGNTGGGIVPFQSGCVVVNNAAP